MYPKTKGAAAARAVCVAVALTASSSAAFAQPAISARITPAPNAAGWNNSDVTVTFQCQRVASCPQPALLSEEGAGWRVTRSVADESGREANATADVNLDRTPPSVTISSPENHSSFETPTVRILASVADSRSGIRSATCNGAAAVVKDVVVTCPVTLQEGLNDVIVQVTDNAGNSASTGIHVSRAGSPAAPTIVPGMATLTNGETRNLQLIDGSGRPLVADSWSVSSPFIAAIEQNGDQISVKGLGPGQVTVTARWQQAAVEATFTVIRATTLPEGTTRWTVSPRPGFTVENIVYTNATPDGPDMFTIERENGGSRVSLKAVTSDPTVLWAESPAIRDDETIIDYMGETFGGVVLWVGAAGRTAFVRAGRPSKGPLWRYEPAGTLARFAQGWDGTIYFVETMSDGYPQFVGLDGATGLVKFRWSVPRSSGRRPDDGCGPDVLRDDAPAVVGQTSVPDGMVAAFVFVTLDEVSDPDACAQGARRFARTLHLARVTPAGDVKVRALKTLAGSTVAGTPAITKLMVIPHPHSAVLVPWIETRADGQVDNHVIRVEGEQLTEYKLPFLGELGIGDDTAYTVTADGQTLVVFDPASGQVRYIRHSLTGKISVAMVTATGGLVIHQKGPLLDENYQPVPLHKKP